MNTRTSLKTALHRLGVAASLLAASAFGATAKPGPDNARVTTTLDPDGGRIVIDAKGVPPPPPTFFSASVEQSVRFGPDDIVGEARVKLEVLQGQPEMLSLGLSGDGEVTDVSGSGLLDWSVRQGAAAPGSAGPVRRFLDLRVVPVAGSTAPQDFELTVRTRLNRPVVPGQTTVLLLGPGEAVGFATKVTLKADPKLDLRIASVAGMTPLNDVSGATEPPQFFATGEGRLEVKLTPRGAAPADAELISAQLSGKLSETGRSVAFRLHGQLRVQKTGARLRILQGRAALSDKPTGDGWHVDLVALPERNFAYELVADREGRLAVDLPFVAEVRENGDWRTLDFAMPAGVAVPLQLDGLESGVSFNPDAPIVPVAAGQGWQGFLPADGSAKLAWRHTHENAEGTLFFTSSEQTEVRVGAGLLRQSARMVFRVLQGKLAGVRCRLESAGEILGVEGTNVVGWKVITADAGRILEVRFSRPVESEGALVIRSQTELGSFPVRAEPLRLVPEGVVRHSGFLRVANSGAVRLEVADAVGMMQLAPAQFPGPATEADACQVFVYRFPSGNYGYSVLASQIQPEVGVSLISTYELAETDRVINASLELDVREAPLRDWSFQIPQDYTVASVTGSDVSDYAAEAGAADGYRALKVLFARPVEGRQLLQVRLEKNQAAAAGDWSLPALRFPGAKSVRGNIGAVATPGFRLVPGKIDGMMEVPLSYFPSQTAGLQQAWRLRDADWSASLRVEALGQSIQADAFHLYSIKEGIVYGSVLLNYFVVGAPATEWRIEVPPSIGNIDVVGQNVRRDWRREGNQVVVSLHQPVLGAATLLLTFEQPMSARGGTIKPGEVRPLGVQSERGYIEVASPLQVKHVVRTAEGGLLKLESLELPAEFRLLTTAPALAVYQYTARPFNLAMDLEWYAPGETVDQVVDFAQLSSQVSRDGQVVTDARYFVKTRGRKALRLFLPEGVKLWEARVDDEMTTARVDGDQTIIPLPARINANEPVAVTLRLGQSAGTSPGNVKLWAPRTVAPTVINEWTLHSDSGYLLVPQGGNAQVIRPSLTESGFDWVAHRGRTVTITLLGVVGLCALFLRAGHGWRVGVGAILGIAAICLAVADAGGAALSRRANVPELAYAATVVPAGENVSIEVGNLRDWRAMIVGWGVVAALVGAGVLVASLRPKIRDSRNSAFAIPAGLVLVAVGLLAQYGGAVYFFAAIALAVLLLLLLPLISRWNRERGTDSPPIRPESGAPVIVSFLAIIGVGIFAMGTPASVRADSPKIATTPWLTEGTRAAQAMMQTWTIHENRLVAELDLTVRGGPGDSFLLLKAPAMLTDFKGDGLRVGKVEHDGQVAYYVAPEREGMLTAHVRFEMPVPDRPGGILVPTGPAAAQCVTIELDQSGWEFVSPSAVQILPTLGLGENRSGATLILAPHGAAIIRLQPRRRDPDAEATQYFAEVANLFVPGPGVVNGFSRVTVRPVQGRVSELDLNVPAGLTVGDVHGGPTGAWRFDPVKHRLHVAIEPAQVEAFKFEVETQLGAGALPFDLALEPLRVSGAAGEVGTMALAFGNDAQPEAVRATGLSAINAQDVDATLLPATKEGRPLATVQQAWRYGQSGGRIDLKVSAVAPEVRVVGKQVLSLDDDRMVMAVDLNVAITRVGLFKLSFALPEGLEVEALSGAALSQWTEAQEGGHRIITLHLNGRTLGEQSFSATLAGAAPHAQAAWAVPRLLIREATRQTGDALVVPGRGIRLQAVDREKVTQVDPRSVGGLQPGTLAFHLLQEDWVLTLGIEALEPWVTVQSLEEVTVREGQTLTRIALRYRVENAGVKQFRVKLPGLSEDRARTVRATGSAVSDMLKVAGSSDLWEIHFQRAIAGETEVQIEYQGPATRELNQETIAAPEFPGARQTSQFVAVRAAGRLELEAGGTPRGWTRTDWSGVPVNLQDRNDRSVPTLCFRVAEPEGPLSVAIRRHEVAEALKLRVTRGDLTTLFSASGAFLTSVELKVDVLEKSTLRVRLPERSSLYNTFVNGESVSVVREGDAYLFHVAPNSGSNGAATVRLVYAVAGVPGGAVGLTGPSLSVPLEKVTWRVVIPPGYVLKDYQGALRLQEETTAQPFGLEQYQSLVASKRSANAQKAVALLEEASSLLQKGDQQQAGEVLSRVSNAQALDEASNEDARVQLRNLKTQQTVLGLNTRRQRLYLDNRVEGARNEQLEQAASLNPLMQGKVNFNPQEMDQLLMGNTVEENAALKGIAGRLVDQQLAAEPAPGAIDVTLTENGRVFTFIRSLQVDGSTPLELKLEIGKLTFASLRFTVLLLLVVAGIAAIPLVRGGESRV